MALLVILVIFCLSLYFRVKLVRKTGVNRKKQLPLPPGPVPWPLVGSLPEMLRNKSVSRWIHQLMNDMDTDISLVRLGNTNIIPVRCPVIAREIFQNKDAIFATRPATYAACEHSRGYLTAAFSNGGQWKKMRKILSSEILCPARHNWLHQKRAEEADNLVLFVHNHYKNNKSVNLRSVARHYSGNVFRRITFGKRYFGKGMADGGPGAEEVEHVEAIFTAVKHVFSFSVPDYLPVLSGLNLDGQEKIVREASRSMRKYQDPIIDERIQQWQTGRKKEMEDLIDVFISVKDTNGEPLLTPNEIKSQAVEFGMATLDNPSSVVEWAMAEMINQPQLLQKATEEIDRVVGKDRLVQESDIPNLNYVKACAREAFRLHPVADFFLPHVSTADTNVAGFFIPRGSHVYLSRYGLGRNPKTWDNHLKFDPDRHLRNGGDRVQLTENDLRFVSFSTGRRGCPGTLLGTCMTTMLLARLLQCFSWSSAENGASVDLSEAEHDLALATPFTAFAEPRLPPHLYPLLN